jgi:protein-S-isoprenylcysteine O-methyltransferase Ste14
MVRRDWNRLGTVMKRVLAFTYGLVCYAIFFVTFLYLIGFVGGSVAWKTVDGPVAESGSAAALVDLLLIGLFGVQHSVMARPQFKRWWTRLIPRPLERSTYVLIASLMLWLLCWQWRPMRGEVWNVRGAAGAAVLTGVSWLGWGTVLLSTFLVDHFDLFGLRQVYLHLRGRPYEPIGFRSLLLYKVVRHPLMLGFLVAFWATPRMTAGHLLFAAAITVYVLVAIRLEERDLVTILGERYRQYSRDVPMLLPVPKRWRRGAAQPPRGSVPS